MDDDDEKSYKEAIKESDEKFGNALVELHRQIGDHPNKEAIIEAVANLVFASMRGQSIEAEHDLDLLEKERRLSE